MSVTIRARLPKGDLNGLTTLERRFAQHILGETMLPEDGTVLVVGIVQADTLELRPHDDDDGQVVKTVLVHLEAIEGADRDRCDKIMRAVYVKRTGKQELPFETDDDGADDGTE